MNTLTPHIIALSLLAVLFSSACIKSEIPSSQTQLGSHHVKVRPSCQSTSTRSHRNQGTSSILFYEFTCGDTTVLVRDNMLSVNGKSYGALSNSDRITVDFGKVRVNSEIRAEVR